MNTLGPLMCIMTLAISGGDCLKDKEFKFANGESFRGGLKHNLAGSFLLFRGAQLYPKNILYLKHQKEF